MKEISIEEKARRYDEAKYIMKEYLESGNAGVIAENTIKKAFPELSESEDEIVIAALKSGINGLLKKEYHLKGIGGISFDRIIDWLEKQAQKPVDKSKIKPKFKTGDRVIGVISGMPYFITGVCDDHYNTESGCIIMFCSQDNFELCEQKPWSEEDEKAINDIMWIIETYRKNGFNKTHIQIADSSENWLKSLKDRVQPKQEWSEEDEEMFNEIIIDLKALKNRDTGEAGKAAYQREIDWLESLRSQSQWKPSEEQMKALNEAIYHVDDNVATQIAMLIGKLSKL